MQLVNEEQIDQTTLSEQRQIEVNSECNRIIAARDGHSPHSPESKGVTTSY